MTYERVYRHETGLYGETTLRILLRFLYSVLSPRAAPLARIVYGRSFALSRLRINTKFALPYLNLRHGGDVSALSRTVPIHDSRRFIASSTAAIEPVGRNFHPRSDVLTRSPNDFVKTFSRPYSRRASSDAGTYKMRKASRVKSSEVYTRGARTDSPVTMRQVNINEVVPRIGASADRRNGRHT